MLAQHLHRSLGRERTPDELAPPIVTRPMSLSHPGTGDSLHKAGPAVLFAIWAFLFLLVPATGMSRHWDEMTRSADRTMQEVVDRAVQGSL